MEDALREIYSPSKCKMHFGLIVKSAAIVYLITACVIVIKAVCVEEVLIRVYILQTSKSDILSLGS